MCDANAPKVSLLRPTLKASAARSDNRGVMGSRRPSFAILALVLAGFVLAPPALASRNAGIAALQVALRARGLYAGTIDGVKGRASGRRSRPRRYLRRAAEASRDLPASARLAARRAGRRPLRPSW